MANNDALVERLTQEVERLLAENVRLLEEKQRDVGVWIKAERDYHDTIKVFRGEEARLTAEVEQMREALEAWNGAVRVDVLMEGSRYMGVEPSRGRHAWELTRIALTPSQEPRP